MLQFIIPIATTIIGSLIGYSIFNSKKSEIYVSALGPSSSGKTTLHNFLRNTNYKDATIGHNNLEKIILKKGYKKVIIKKGKDISGSEQAVTNYYKAEIKVSDVCFFIFDSSKILKNESYSKNVNARLNFINKYIKASKKENLKILLLASHFDKVKNQTSAKKLIWSKINKIANEGKINKPTYINLTDNNQLENLKNELFK